jgi:hypothetical protein
VKSKAVDPPADQHSHAVSLRSLHLASLHFIETFARLTRLGRLAPSHATLIHPNLVRKRVSTFLLPRSPFMSLRVLARSPRYLNAFVAYSSTTDNGASIGLQCHLPAVITTARGASALIHLTHIDF